MELFETKESKATRLQKEQKEFEEEQRKKQEKEKQERDRIKKEKEDKFMEELEQKKQKKIITLVLSDYEGNDWKELAMNYLLENGYVCVQNDVTSTKCSAHYVLTFVRRDYTSFFLNIKK